MNARRAQAQSQLPQPPQAQTRRPGCAVYVPFIVGSAIMLSTHWGAGAPLGESLTLSALVFVLVVVMVIDLATNRGGNDAK